MWISGQRMWITVVDRGLGCGQLPFGRGRPVDERVVPGGLCVDWHTPGPAGIGADGEMWTGYPQPVRSEIHAVTRDSGVIHVLPTSTT